MHREVLLSSTRYGRKGDFKWKGGEYGYTDSPWKDGEESKDICLHGREELIYTESLVWQRIGDMGMWRLTEIGLTLNS